MLQYPNVAQFLLSYLDPILRSYEQEVLNQPNPPQVRRPRRTENREGGADRECGQGQP